MKKVNLFDKITELKECFKEFFQHRKKITALENFSASDQFQHKKYLVLVKSCLEDGFLEEQESEFLSHMLKKYELNYLDWAHKTKWLKKKMKETKKKEPRMVQTHFDFYTNLNVPVEIMNQGQRQAGQRV